MREKLNNLLNNSYAKYSKFRVACICVMNDKKEFSGVNVENASYGATICAERVAITSAVTAGYRKGDFKELHIMADSEKIAYPCFICRQVITEFFSDDARIYLYSKNTIEVIDVKEFCPLPFNEDNL